MIAFHVETAFPVHLVFPVPFPILELEIALHRLERLPDTRAKTRVPKVRFPAYLACLG